MSTPDRPTPGRAEPKGFRPTSKRRARIAGGAALAAIAIGGNALVYSSLDDQAEVLQVTRNVRAGEMITVNDLRVVEADLDPTVPSVSADQIGLVANQYARAFIPSGTLIFDQMVQPQPLVAEGTSLVAFAVGASRLPTGVTERSQIEMVYTVGDEWVVTRARVARIDRDDDGSAILTVEVALADAAVVASSDDIRVVLVDPGVDPVTEPADVDGDG